MICCPLVGNNVSYIHSNSTLSNIQSQIYADFIQSDMHVCTYVTERTLGEDINLLNEGSRGIILDDRENRTRKKKHKYYLQQAF